MQVQRRQIRRLEGPADGLSTDTMFAHDVFVFIHTDWLKLSRATNVVEFGSTLQVMSSHELLMRDTCTPVHPPKLSLIGL